MLTLLKLPKYLCVCMYVCSNYYSAIIETVKTMILYRRSQWESVLHKYIYEVM